VLDECAKLPKEDSFLIMVVTDGGENDTRCSVSTLRSKIKKAIDSDRYTITYQVPQGYGTRLVSDLGLQSGNIGEWEIGTDRGVQESSIIRTASLGSYFNARASGQRSTGTFYTNASNIKTTDLKSLEDISRRVKTFQVEREVDITSFVNTKVGSYTPGAAFYLLMKTEEIQDHKKLLIRPKGKKSIYTGDKVRSLLGLPNGRVRVKPGNHGDYDIFVQSTSNNRKLVRGTTLVYDTKLA
jgi:hypothetical protein